MRMAGYRKVVTRNIDRSNVDWSPMISYDLGKSKFVVLRILGVRSMESCFEQTWVKQDGLYETGEESGIHAAGIDDHLDHRICDGGRDDPGIDAAVQTESRRCGV